MDLHHQFEPWIPNLIQVTARVDTIIFSEMVLCPKEGGRQNIQYLRGTVRIVTYISVI